ncbi:uncharacterized protein MELLADRAFT_63201 [Melampsora larici-populina 98AG31]|uniref:Secreted protein n=1 Tax=Melampsora larici-populina (strain 98AG31 / pathotype 3-4-7) TaxID=747676 RepID=F4RLT3_MELLP|nr:uncharacterized protein MELLADRAFT_63201 [Melampsora larici-populina 98AG31]EGG06593.1 secreted protein [Melampsora larici-populina 98AG31]
MLLFQSPHKLIIAVILICITQSSFTSSKTTVTCVNGFGVQSPATTAGCNDNNFSSWNCPTASCQKDGHQWVLMTNCVLAGVAGTSKQQCASYNPGADPTKYECRNSGGQSYLCPYTPANVPTITCKDCTMPHPESKPKPVGPKPRRK